MNLLKVLMLSMLVYANNVFAISFPEAQEVYKHLKEVNHLHNYKLLLVKTRQVNAWSYSGKVYITTGLLHYLKNDSEVAFVLGHESGHLILHHTYNNWPHEYAADVIGVKLAVNVGYSKCLSLQALKRLHDAGSDTHPPSNARVKRLGC